MGLVNHVLGPIVKLNLNRCEPASFHSLLNVQHGLDQCFYYIQCFFHLAVQSAPVVRASPVHLFRHHSNPLWTSKCWFTLRRRFSTPALARHSQARTLVKISNFHHPKPSKV